MLELVLLSVNYIQKITFSGSIGYQAPTFSDLSDGEIYSFGPSISWAAFDFGRLRARIDVAESATREALLAFEQAVLLALEDVENALSRYRSEKQRVIELKNAYESAEKSYQIAELQYKEGALDFLAVLDAQRSLLETQNAFVQSKENLHLALVGVYKSLGGGLASLGIFPWCIFPWCVATSGLSDWLFSLKTKNL